MRHNIRFVLGLFRSASKLCDWPRYSNISDQLDDVSTNCVNLTNYSGFAHCHGSLSDKFGTKNQISDERFLLATMVIGVRSLDFGIELVFLWVKNNISLKVTKYSIDTENSENPFM